MIYLDNAASSWPKPPSVVRRAQRWIADNGANPGRSNHRPAQSAGRALREARARLASLLRVRDPSRIVLTSGATHAINIALRGILSPGDHVVTTVLEHNSVLRPLSLLEDETHVRVTVVPPGPDGRVRPVSVARALEPDTRLVAVTHASNVTGAVQPVPEIVRSVRRRAGHAVAILVDAAQTAGVVDLPAERWGVDLVALAGHKGLFGLQGTGALYVGEAIALRPLLAGGTGTSSHDARHPTAMPDRLEAGTPNTPGFVALAEGLRFLEDKGVSDVRRHEGALRDRLVRGLRRIDRVEVLASGGSGEEVVSVASFRVDGQDPVELSFLLDRRHDIAVRAGVHCAPWTHRWLGTLSSDGNGGGALRASPGLFTTEDDIDALLDATGEIVASPPSPAR